MHISSVFFAIFDDAEGPRILYQVPEDLITTPPRRAMDAHAPTPVPSSDGGSNLNTPAIEVEPSSVPDLSLLKDVDKEGRDSLSKKDLSTLGANKDSKRSNNSSKSKLNASTSSRLNLTKNNSSVSPNRTSLERNPPSNGKTLFEWDLVSQFVIPRADVCGRLTISMTKKHRIVGFPVILRDPHYDRGTFQFNICFVFEKNEDVRSYESIVRKLARVLTTCEIEYRFLSSPTTNHKVYPILEQLFTDLNSFSETSIRIDPFNSLELRIFPRYPNPPPVNAWDVPVPLIDLGNKHRMEENLDLTMKKVAPFINGVDHVKKIAMKADADIVLVKECMSQVMMYQCVMMIDIFQFSNLYTLCRPVMWLFTDPAIYEECGPYVHKGESELFPWPRLAWWYARLKPPLTVGKWISQYGIDLERIDVRRFISFGVIKGFLRRVHRWPILLKDDKIPMPSVPLPSKRRQKSINWTTNLHRPGNEFDPGTSYSDPPPGLSSAAGMITLSSPENERNPHEQPPPLLREDTLKPLDSGGGIAKLARDRIAEKERVGKHAPMGGISASNPSSYVSPSVLKSRINMGGVSSLESSQTLEDEDPRAASLPVAQELAEQAYNQGQAVAKMKHTALVRPLEIPPDLTELLDGTHHSDELCVHFGLSWNVLHATLSVIGGGTGDDEDLGRVAILYR